MKKIHRRYSHAFSGFSLLCALLFLGSSLADTSSITATVGSTPNDSSATAVLIHGVTAGGGNSGSGSTTGQTDTTDSDGDGLPDEWEKNNGTDPDLRDDYKDYDDDGLTNAEEYKAGAFPWNAYSDEDSKKDGEDAVPIDAAITWNRTPDVRYLLVELAKTEEQKNFSANCIGNDDRVGLTWTEHLFDVDTRGHLSIWKEGEWSDVSSDLAVIVNGAAQVAELDSGYFTILDDGKLAGQGTWTVMVQSYANATPGTLPWQLSFGVTWANDSAVPKSVGAETPTLTSWATESHSDFSGQEDAYHYIPDSNLRASRSGLIASSKSTTEIKYHKEYEIDANYPHDTLSWIDTWSREDDYAFSAPGGVAAQYTEYHSYDTHMTSTTTSDTQSGDRYIEDSITPSGFVRIRKTNEPFGQFALIDGTFKSIDWEESLGESPLGDPIIDKVEDGKPSSIRLDSQWVTTKQEVPLIYSKLGSGLSKYGQQLWRNGFYLTAEQFVLNSSRYAWVFTNDINDKGLICGTLGRVYDDADVEIPEEDRKSEPFLGIPFEIAPEVVRMNGNFDEGRIEPATGYALRDCDDVDLEADRDSYHDRKIRRGKIVTKDLSRNFFGVRPDNLPELWQSGATITIEKLQETDSDTGRPENGEIRIYAIRDLGKTGEYAYVIPLTEADPNNPGGPARPRNLASVLYGPSPQIPKGDDVQYWMEGIKPGPITLEFKYTKGSVTFSHKQKFKVCTEQSKTEWQKEARDEILLETGGQIDTDTYKVAGGPFLDLGQTKYFAMNKENILAVYKHYEKIYMVGQKEYLWAGLAKLAGAPIYAGLSDAQWGRVGGYLLPSSMNGITKSMLANIQNILVQANIDIYRDLAWQFAAYRCSGISALKYVRDQNPVALNYPAWQDIDDGAFENDQTKIWSGNVSLLRREQENILASAYLNLDSLGFGAVSWLFSILSLNPVPGGPRFETVVPGGNLANFNDRWNWITDNPNGIWNLWKDAALSSRKEWVQIPLRSRAENYKRVPFLSVW